MNLERFFVEREFIRVCVCVIHELVRVRVHHTRTRCVVACHELRSVCTSAQTPLFVKREFIRVCVCVIHELVCVVCTSAQMYTH